MDERGGSVKRRILCLLLCLGIGALCSCTPQEEPPQNPPENPAGGNEQQPEPEAKLPELVVTVLKLGKADSILIELDGQAMLIDTGEEEDGSRVAAVLRDRGIKKLDYLLLTHLDKDHIGGAPRVMADVEIGQLIQSHNTEDSDEYAAYQAELQEDGITPVYLRKTMEFSLAGADVRLLPAAQGAYEKDNDYSIMAELTYGDKRFLFAGDAEELRLREYLAGGVEPFDYVKMPHHGREDPMTAAFVQEVQPRYAVITCSKKNPADRAVIKALEDVDCQVFLTQDGYVEAKTDGKELTVKQY